MVDRKYEAVSFQVKFIIAVVASTCGSCYPFLILASTELAVLTLFLTASRRDYCNVLSVCTPPFRTRVTTITALPIKHGTRFVVLLSHPPCASLHQMNSIRFGGLLTAATCGLFALRVLWVYRRHDNDSVFESLVRGHCSEASLPLVVASASGSTSSSWSGSGSPLDLVTTGTYAMFGALLFVVLASVITGEPCAAPELERH